MRGATKQTARGTSRASRRRVTWLSAAGAAAAFIGGFLPSVMVAAAPPAAAAVAPDETVFYGGPGSSVGSFDLTVGGNGPSISAPKPELLSDTSQNGKLWLGLDGGSSDQIEAVGLPTPTAGPAITLTALGKAGAPALSALFDTPDGTKVYAADSNGGLVSVTVSNSAVSGVLDSGYRIVGFTENPSTKYVYAVGTNISTKKPFALVINQSNNSLVATVALPSAVNFPVADSYDSATGTVYVLGTPGGDDNPGLVPILVAKNTVGDSINLGLHENAMALAISPDGQTAFVPIYSEELGSGTVNQVYLTGQSVGAVAHSWSVSGEPTAVAVEANPYEVFTSSYVPNSSSTETVPPPTPGSTSAASYLTEVNLSGSSPTVTAINLPAGTNPLSLAIGPTAPPVTSLQVSLSAGASSVPAGIRTVPLDNNANLPAGAVETTSNGQDTTQNVASAPLGTLDLNAKALSTASAAPLGTLPLGTLPLGTIGLNSIPGAAQGLAGILLSNLPITYPPGCSGTSCTGWSGLFSDTGSALAQRPLQAVSLADVVSDSKAESRLQSLPLGTLDLSTSTFGGIPLESLAVGTIPLSSIPLSSSDTSAGLALHDWCTQLAAAGHTCASLGITDPGPTPSSSANLYPNVTPLSLSLASVPLGTLPLGTLPLGTLPLSGSPLGTLPLGTLDLSSSPLGTIPLGTLPLTTSPLGTLPLGTLPLGTLPLGTLPLGTLPLGTLPLGTLPLGTLPLGTLPLGTIPLSSIPSVSSIVNCSASGISCSPPSSTLQQAASAGAIQSSATLSQLGVYAGTTLAQLAGVLSTATLNQTTLGQLGVYANTSLSQLGTYGSTTVAGLGWYGYGALSASQVAALPLGTLPLGTLPLGTLPLGTLSLGSSPLGTLPLGTLPLGTLPLGTIPLGTIQINNTPLGTLPLSSIPNVGSIVNCSASGISCTTSTLGQAQNADAISASATLAQLTIYNGMTLGQLAGATTDARLAQTTLAQLGYYGSATVASVDPSGQTTLSQIQSYLQILLDDILRTILPPAQYQWSNVNLSNPALPNASADGGQVQLTATVTLGGDGALTNVAFHLPNGYTYVPGSARVNGAAAPDPASSGSNLTESALLPIGSSTVALTVKPNEVLGQAPVSATATAATFTANSNPLNLLVTDPFEPNGTPGQAMALPPDTLAASFITSPTDTDYWSINVPSGDVLALSLSNLPSDYDLVLYGPPAAQLQNPPNQTIAGVTEQTPATQASSPAVQFDAPGTGDIPLLAGTPVVAVSDHRGTANETIQTLPLSGGTYTIQVDGYNGAFSTVQPYVLRAKLLSTPFSATCAAPTYPNAMGSAGALPSSYPANVNTVFLVNQQRLVAAYGSTAAGNVEAALNNAVASGAGGMVGAVVPVDGDSATQSAYSSWDSNPCSVSAANGVVSAIGKLVDGIVTAHPTVRNLVVVGADDQIPMGRVPDQTVQDNETDYAAGTLPGFRDQLSSALSEGYFLSDDPYASPSPLGVGGQTLYTPQLALGRLVETPSEIIGALNRFVSTNGVLAAGSALSTGYDFLDSGANAIAANLANGGSSVTKLIDTDASGNPWTAAELNSAIQGPNISSISGHFDFSRTLSAAGNSAGNNDILSTSQVRSDGSAAFSGRLLLSMGCHSGLNIPLNEVSNLLPNGEDSWAKLFADEGAVWVANTGYGYADTESLAYSARLMSDFAAGLDGSATVGQALADAKQRFAADTAVLDPYDLKASMESTYYGMPNYTLTGLKASPPPQPAVLPVGVDPATQLTVAQVHLNLAQNTCPGQLSQKNGPTGGTYFQLNPVGVPNPNCPATQIPYNNQNNQLDSPGVQATGGFPIEPLADMDVTQPSSGGTAPVAHGALITGLTSTDIAGVTPAIAPVQTDLAAHEPPVSAGITDFPSVLQRVSSYQTVPASGNPVEHQQLDLITGQFISSGNATGTQRLFTSMDASILYTPAGDTNFAPPTIRQVNAFIGSTSSANTVTFAVNVTPSSTSSGSAVKEVLVLFTGCTLTGTSCVVPAAGSQNWTATQLFQDQGGSWVGGATAPSSGHVAYLVEAVDGNGNVTVSSNKGTEFNDETQSPQGNLTIGVTPLGSQTPNGSFYTGPVNVTITSANGGQVNYQVDNSSNSGPSPVSFSVGDDGTHVITASDAFGDQVTTVVRIDTTAPVISALVTSPRSYNASTGTTWYGAGTTLQLSAADQGSGVASLSVTAPGQPTAQTAGPGPLDVTPPNGTTTYTVTSVDNAGNTSSTTVTVSVDNAAPTVTCPQADSSWHTANITVSCTASDSETGLATAPPYQLSTSVPANTSSTTAMTNSQSVCDNVGNCASAGPLGPYKIDLTTPTISITTTPTPPNPAVSTYAVHPPSTLYIVGQSVPLAYSCSDAGGSGIATCAGTVNGTPIASGSSLPTSSPGTYTLTVTAASVAGTMVTQTFQYVVTYGICGYTPGTSVVGAASLNFSLQLCNASAANVGSTNITLTAASVDGNTTPSGVVGNNFTFSAGTYSYNLLTVGLASGSHTLWVTATGDPVTHGLAFTVS